MLKWTLRIAGGVLALVFLGCAGVFVSYSLWMSNHKAELRAGSEIASTALGEIEYAIWGEGQPRLMLHGTPGGYDMSLIGPRVLQQGYSDVQVISVSRPGYLRTPLESGASPEEQADLYAALLDELGKDRVVVVGMSGGGPSALQMAIRHPERVEALVLIVPALAMPDVEATDAAPSYLMAMVQNMAIYLMGDSMAASVIPDFDPDNETHVAFAKHMMRSVVPALPRGAGQNNDLAHFLGLDTSEWPLESVSVPTLLLHGNADSNAPYEGSVSAAARIPGAELITFEGGEHMVVATRADEIAALIRDFLARRT